MLKTQIIGNLGSDPELRYSAQGTAVLTFNVASNGRQKVGDDWQDRTEWVRCRVLGQRAEGLSQHLHKGQRVYVDGRLEAHPWLTRDSTPMAGLEVLADVVEFMSPRQDDQSGAARPSRQPVGAGAGRSSRPTSEDVSYLEDLPF